MQHMARENQYVPALGFHWLTPFYDAVVGATTREKTFKKALIQQAGFRTGHNVLDLACGTGTMTLWVKQAHPDIEVIGVDGDERILGMARKKAEKAGLALQFDQALSFELPYPENHFDRVISSLFFHHLVWKDKQRTAAELFRVLKPGGELHVADWGRAANPLMRALFFFIQLLDGFENTRDNVSGRLEELFAAAGFHQVTQTRTYSTIFGTMALYSAVKPE